MATTPQLYIVFGLNSSFATDYYVWGVQTVGNTVTDRIYTTQCHQIEPKSSRNCAVGAIVSTQISRLSA